MVTERRKYETAGSGERDVRELGMDLHGSGRPKCTGCCAFPAHTEGVGAYAIQTKTLKQIHQSIQNLCYANLRLVTRVHGLGDNSTAPHLSVHCVL